jgi:hypothetical protein
MKRLSPFIFLGKCSPRSFGGCRPLVVACMPKFRSWACGRKTLSEIYPHWRPVFVKDTGQIFFGKTMEIPFLRDIEQTCMLETLAIEPGDSHAQTKKTFQIQSNFIFDPRASSHAGRVWFLFAGCNFLNMDLKLGEFRRGW